ncbi:MAG: tetratricopeptide repeat protein [Terriglobales bacterium]|jgi:tetratricopeptide (TPR) repeat protein|nr:tetratricopeptide repeat protein [Terriglobales bacterium]
MKLRITVLIFISLLLATVTASTSAAADESAPALLAAGRADDAIATLHSKINTAPNDGEAYNLLCRAYFSTGEWDRGISACEKAVELQPNNSRYHMWLGRIYGEKADGVIFFKAASLAGKVREQFEAAVRLDPNNVDARSDLGEFYLEAPGIVGGGRDKAEAQAKALAILDPAKAHYLNGRIAEKKKDLETAEKEYRAAIEASHGSALTWFNLALFYRHQQRWDDMEAAINRAVSAQMDRPEILMESGEVLLRSGRNFPAAVQFLRRYLALNSKVEEAPAFKAHYLLGTALEKQGDKQAAAQEYRAALSLARGFSRAQEALDRLNR